MTMNDSGTIPTRAGQEQPRLSEGWRLTSGHCAGALCSVGGCGAYDGCHRILFMLPWVPLLSAGEISSTSAWNSDCSVWSRKILHSSQNILITSSFENQLARQTYINFIHHSWHFLFASCMWWGHAGVNKNWFHNSSWLRLQQSRWSFHDVSTCLAFVLDFPTF